MSRRCIPLSLAGLLACQLPAFSQQQPLPAVPATRVDANVNTNFAPPQSTILPTDILPMATTQNRLTFGENLQLRLLQKLPSNFYFNATAESSFRYETNVYQFPKKQTLLHQLPAPQEINRLPFPQQVQLVQLVAKADSEDVVYRILPNVTGGFTLTPRTRVFANYFMISDTLTRNKRLDTVIHSYAGGIQQDMPIGSRGNLQAEMQFRELNQMHQQSVFDFLPGLTYSQAITPRLVVFVNALAQLRGKKYFQAPTKEIDPFYTWGGLYQRGGWTFSASTTFVQNFRQPFVSHATIPVNNYSFISDFEVARRLLPQVPGLQAFVRAEPIWNIQKHNRPGLAGTDFRLYMGMRMAVSKPSLTVGMIQLQQQIKEQEQEPPTPQPGPGQNKPSAFVPQQELISMEQQPIHGVIPLIDAMPATSCSTPAKSRSQASSLPLGSPISSLARIERPSL